MGFDSMQITVTLSRNKETNEVTLSQGSSVIDLLKKLKLKPDTLIVMHDKKPIPIDDKLTNGQSLIILQVSSGG